MLTIEQNKASRATVRKLTSLTFHKSWSSIFIDLIKEKVSKTFIIA